MIDFPALGIAINLRGPVEQRVACPQCAKTRRDDALGVNTDTGAFHCFRCGMKGRAGSDLKVIHGSHLITRIDDPAIAERKRERLRAVWRATVELSHAKARAVRAYLEARALGEILKNPVALRAHPGLDYWEGHSLLGRFPAMIALFRGTAGDAITLHCTWLREDGCAKASVPSPKKILGVPVKGATRGGAIHLYQPRRGVLGIAEGIESALSLHLMKGIPTWSAYCAENLSRLWIPASLRELHIAVDIDPGGKGRSVAEALAARVCKRSPQTRCTLVLPDDDLDDLNSELMAKVARQ